MHHSCFTRRRQRVRHTSTFPHQAPDVFLPLTHHTDVLQHLEDHRSQQDEGIRNHKEHIEMSLASLQQQNMELETQARQLKEQHSTLSSFKTILQSQYDINTKGLTDVHKRFETHAREQEVHATALQNHMEVIQSHVGILNAQDADIGLHSEALIKRPAARLLAALASVTYSLLIFF